MLTDPEIDALAEAHAQVSARLASAAHRVVAVRQFALPDPAGVYFTLRIPDPGGFLVGASGFFVSRVDGAIREFGSGEGVYTAAALAPKPGGPPPGVLTPAIVHHLLTQPPNEELQRRGFEALITRGRRRWWQFWK